MSSIQIPQFFPGQRVLLVEDLIALAIQYRTLAAKLQVEVTTAGTVAQALRQVREGPWHAALIDLNLPDGSGFEVMQALLKAHPGCAIVVITAEDSIDNAVRASEAGAFDFIEKPVEAERLLVTLRNALSASQQSQRIAKLEIGNTNTTQQFEQFTGSSPQMQTIYRMIETVASSNAPVCITGESGTGKELVALAIHARSPRKAKKLVPINCAAIPRELIESELFGHAKGAFTGASSDRTGAFMEADGGTLFLDEIAELDISVQAKLLRVLQTGEVKRLGDDKTRIVDVRIVCATHRSLAVRVRTGTFREDLFYRLYVVPIELPPLRARAGDVMQIARELLTRYAREDGKQLASFSLEAIAALQAYQWPGNVRELVNVVRAVVALNDGPVVELGMLPSAVTENLEVEDLPSRSLAGATLPTPLESEDTQWFALPLPESDRLPSGTTNSMSDWLDASNGAVAITTPAVATTASAVATTAPAVAIPPQGIYSAANVRPLADLEREAVDYALRAFGGNVSQAARALQMNPSTLYRKIQIWTTQGFATDRSAAQAL